VTFSNHELNKAFARQDQRKAAEAKCLRELEEEKKRILAPPPNPKIINEIRRTLESQERELKRIIKIRDTDITRYYDEKLDERYTQLIST
jgi:hypothetical protein